MGISLETLTIKEKIKIIDLIQGDALDDYFIEEMYYFTLNRNHPDKWMLEYVYNEELQQEFNLLIKNDIILNRK